MSVIVVMTDSLQINTVKQNKTVAVAAALLFQQTPFVNTDFTGTSGVSFFALKFILTLQNNRPIYSVETGTETLLPRDIWFIFKSLIIEDIIKQHKEVYF